MEVLAAELESRTEFFREISPDIARKMSEALQKLTGKDIKVEFCSIETFEQNAIFIEANEKFFGSFACFKNPNNISTLGKNTLEGIVVTVFPLASTKTLTDILSNRYIKKADKEKMSNKINLSAFKEAANILALTYITGIANILKVKMEIGMPKFASFRNSIEFIKHTSLRDHSDPGDLVSVKQFSITGKVKGLPTIKGRFIIVF